MNRIRAARQALGWTQDELASKSRVSPRTIYAVEQGQPCRQATKRKLLQALGVAWEMRGDFFPTPRKIKPAATHVTKSA